MSKKCYSLAFIILFASLLCSCRSDRATNDKNLVQDFKKVDFKSVSDTISVNRTITISQDEDSLVIATPMRILNVRDNFLVVTENRSESFINVFSLPDVRHLYSFGTLSDGPEPDEFQSVPMYYNVSEDELISYDGLSRQLSFFQLKDSTISKTKEVRLSYDGQMDPLNRVRRIRDDLFFADYGSSFENTNHEHIALEPGVEDSLFTFGRYPESDLEGFERYGQFMKENVVKPDGTRFATFYFRYNALKIFTSEGKRIEAIKVNDPFFEERLSEDTDDYMYRTAAAASDNFIYTLGYYMSRENILSENRSEATFFEVWNWDGEPVYRASFDRFIDNFTVSESHHKIYAYNKSVDDTIFEYNLPQDLIK